MEEIKIKMFETNEDKSPKVKWQDVEPNTTLKEIFDLKKLPYENCGIVVPHGFTVYDFDCPENINTTFFKEKVIEMVGESITNLVVETDKGIHLWTRGDIPQTAKKVSSLGLLFDVRAAEKGYVVIQRKGIKRTFFGSPNYHSWSKVNIPSTNWRSLSKEEGELFVGLLQKKDFKGSRNDTLFKIYKPFLLYKLEMKTFGAIYKNAKAFNKFWKWGMSDEELKTIMTLRKKETNGDFTGRTPNMEPQEKAQLRQEMYEKLAKEQVLSPFVLTIEENKLNPEDYKIIVKKNAQGVARVQFDSAKDIFWREHPNRVVIFGDIFFIINEEGVWMGNPQFIEDYVRRWLRIKGSMVAKADYEMLVTELRSIAEVKHNHLEFAYLLNDKKVLIKDCQVEELDNEKHQVIAKINLDLVEEVEWVRVQKFLNFIQPILKHKEEEDILLAHVRYLLMPNKKGKKMLLLQGKKNSGKSTFCGLMRAGLGIKNVKNIQLGAIFGERFGTSEIVGSVMFFDDDVEGYFDKANLGFFKSLISNPVIRVEFKYSTPYNELVSGKLWACSNDTLRVQNKEGVDNRIDIIEFQPVEKMVSYIEDQFTREDYQHFFTWLIKERTDLDLPLLCKPLINQAKANYLLKNNSVFKFFAFQHAEKETHNMSYSDYAMWCGSYKYKSVNIDHFTEEKQRWDEEYFEQIEKFI